MRTSKFLMRPNVLIFCRFLKGKCYYFVRIFHETVSIWVLYEYSCGLLSMITLIQTSGTSGYIRKDNFGSLQVIPLIVNVFKKCKSSLF